MKRFKQYLTLPVLCLVLFAACKADPKIDDRKRPSDDDKPAEPFELNLQVSPLVVRANREASVKVGSDNAKGGVEYTFSIEKKEHVTLDSESSASDTFTFTTGALEKCQTIGIVTLRIEAKDEAGNTGALSQPIQVLAPWCRYTKDNGLLDNHVLALETDTSQAIWVGTQIGVNRFDGQKWEKFDGTTHSNAFGGRANISVLERGPDNIMWAGYGATDSGARRYKDGSWSVYSKTSSEGELVGQQVFAIAVNGSFVTLGTSRGVSMSTNGGEGKFTALDQGFLDHPFNVGAMAYAKNNLWVGTRYGTGRAGQGLAVYPDGTFKKAFDGTEWKGKDSINSQALSNKDFRVMRYHLQSDTLWAAFGNKPVDEDRDHGGLLRWHNRVEEPKFRFQWNEGGDDFNDIRDITFDNQNRVFVATKAGVLWRVIKSEADIGEFELLSADLEKQPEGLSTNDITALTFDAKSNLLWIGTTEGLVSVFVEEIK